MGSLVAIVGRPNVGKSTLFNRLTETNLAIVDEQAGVTRDRIYGKALWNGIEFSVIDTGGYVVGSDDIFEEEIRKQVAIAIEEADIILFITDVRDGVTPLDQEVAQILRQSGKPVILVVNKVDQPSLSAAASEFFSLGLGQPFTISSANGGGTGDMLDVLVRSFSKTEKEPETEPSIPRIAVVGRPNVGKSSLVNALLGEERNIVTPLPGTTRDSIYTRYRKFHHDFYLIDTAGLRKKSRVSEDLEFYAVMRAIRAIEHSDVCLLLIDATRGMESQDLNIFHLAVRNKKGIVIAVNKWDLMEKSSNTAKEFSEHIRNRIAPFTDVPIIFTSVLQKQRIHKALESVMNVYTNRQRKIPTSRLNEVMLEAIGAYPPPSVKGKYVKIKYVAQLPTPTPAFAFFCNLPQYIREPYKRYLENKIREHFVFTGVPVEIFFRQK